MIPTASNIAAARRSWERVLAVTDPDGQQVMRALWATVWARVLLAEDRDFASIDWFQILTDIVRIDAKRRFGIDLNPIAGTHPGDDARRGVISPRSRPAALPDEPNVYVGESDG